MVFWELIRFLHLLAVAFFIGGQLVLVAAVVPVERGNPQRERMQAIARRFGYGTLAAVGILIITGSMMASHFYQWSNPKLNMKLGFVAITGLLILWHMRRPKNHLIEAAIFVFSLAAMWLGVTLAH